MLLELRYTFNFLGSNINVVRSVGCVSGHVSCLVIFTSLTGPWTIPCLLSMFLLASDHTMIMEPSKYIVFSVLTYRKVTDSLFLILECPRLIKKPNNNEYHQ